MAKFIAIANQKGGVGKTTSTMNLGVALKKKGKRVLLVDFDSQANLSEYLRFGENGEDEEISSISDLMLAVINNQPITVENSIIHDTPNDIDYIPSDLNLATIENYLSNTLSRETVLKRVFLDSSVSTNYDYVLIDCPPTLAILLINALTLCDKVLIPVQTHKFALDGLAKLNDVVTQIKSILNPHLDIVGIVPTLTDNTKVSKNTLDTLNNTYAELMFNTVIPRCVEAPNSAQSGISVCLQRGSKLGEAYLQLADELISREETHA